MIAYFLDDCTSSEGSTDQSSTPDVATPPEAEMTAAFAVILRDRFGTMVGRSVR